MFLKVRSYLSTAYSNLILTMELLSPHNPIFSVALVLLIKITLFFGGYFEF
jgi:hypothetical protein